MAWILLIACFGLVFGPAIAIARNLLPGMDRPAYERADFVTLFATIIVIGVALLLVWSYLFLVAWFLYLRSLRPSMRKMVEQRIQRVLNVAAFEPAYSRVRRRFFLDDGA